MRGKAVVEFVVNVDRPELRGPSFVPTKEYKLVTRLYPETRNEALRVVAALMAGEQDFASEYVSRVQAFYQGGRQIRKMHSRSARDGEWVLGG